MNRPVILRPEARAELDQAVDWYEQQAGLGADFLARVQDVLDRIAATPEMHALIYRDVRRSLVRRYPYSIMYLVEPAQVVIISVFHNRRDPSIWQARA